ncbi:MAG: Holliday junction resolvase RuvX [Candidatus Cloacimonadota bacterium]|nr:MAG: Holliday junction resolvase RuvX [Candidatus Cloacimonadota bacterium]
MKLFRIMGIDYGSVRIGIALSDPLQIISRPYKVIANSGEETFSEIKKIIEKEKVGKIVLGLPLNLEGKDSVKTEEVRKFGKLLQRELSIPIIFWDERFSSVEANEILKKMGYNFIESKKHIDKIAASLILKNYLEDNN